jgi:hypothetical protein
MTNKNNLALPIIGAILLFILLIGVAVIANRNKIKTVPVPVNSSIVYGDELTKVTTEKVDKKISFIYEKNNNIYLKNGDEKEQFIFSRSVGDKYIGNLAYNQEKNYFVYTLDGKIQKYMVTTKEVTTIAESTINDNYYTFSVDGTKMFASKLLDSGQCELDIKDIETGDNKVINYEPLINSSANTQWKSCQSPAYLTADGSLFNIAQGEGDSTWVVNVNDEKPAAKFIKGLDAIDGTPSYSSEIDRIVSISNLDDLVGMLPKIYNEKERQYLIDFSNDKKEALAFTYCGKEVCSDTINGTVYLWKINLETGEKTKLNSFSEWNNVLPVVYTKNNSDTETSVTSIFVNDTLTYKTNGYVSIIKTFIK